MPLHCVCHVFLVLIASIHLFSRQMTSPTTVGNAYVLSRPTLSWEKVRFLELFRGDIT
jgi:hypothetical protein